jgi:zinc transporter ZupT
MGGFYALLIAVLGHKLLDGFALGIPVYFAKLPLSQTLFALIFCALMTPLGIGIGLAATESLSGPKAQLAEAIILSMSCGSFYFISLVELLPSGLERHGWIKTKLASAFVGFGIMAFIALYV